MPEKIKKLAESLRQGRRGARRRATAAAVSAAAAAALLLGSLFATPAELLRQDAPAAIVAVQLNDDDGGDAEAAAEPEEERKRGPRAALSRFFRRQPTAVKLVLLCPLWAAGKAALLLLSALGGPLLSALAGPLLNFALLGLLFLAAYKLLFPAKSVKSFFKRRNILALAAGACLLSAADALLPLWWEDWESWSVALRCLLGGGTVCGLWFVIFGRSKKITEK